MTEGKVRIRFATGRLTEIVSCDEHGENRTEKLALDVCFVIAEILDGFEG